MERMRQLTDAVPLNQLFVTKVSNRPPSFHFLEGTSLSSFQGQDTKAWLPTVGPASFSFFAGPRKLILAHPIFPSQSGFSGDKLG
jgi:hypothetical protein